MGERKQVHSICRKRGFKSQSDGGKVARILTVWKDASLKPRSGTRNNHNNGRSPKPIGKANAVKVKQTPVVRDNSNRAADFTAAAPISEEDDEETTSPVWICEVCEAENEGSVLTCDIC